MGTLTVIFFIALSGTVHAHPGNTAADGCHYCRTNCDKWGVPWNERHCHHSPSKSETPPPPGQVKTQATSSTRLQIRSSQSSSQSLLRSSSNSSRSIPKISEQQIDDFIQAVDEAKKSTPEDSMLGTFLSAVGMIAAGFYAFRKIRKR